MFLCDKFRGKPLPTNLLHPHESIYNHLFNTNKITCPLGGTVLITHEHWPPTNKSDSTVCQLCNAIVSSITKLSVTCKIDTFMLIIWLQAIYTLHLEFCLQSHLEKNNKDAVYHQKKNDLERLVSVCKNSYL